MSNRKLVGTEFRNEFLRSLNILAPRIAAAIERYGSDPLIVDSLKVNDQLTANSATFSAGVQIDTTLTLKDIGTHADTPASGFGVIYVNGDVPYFKDDGGTATSMIASGGGSGSPGGSDTQIQYNNGGSFGGVASLTFDDSSGHLTVIDDKKLQFGTGNDASIEYDEDGNDVLAIDGAATKFTVAGVEIENGSTTGAAALTIDNDDTDQIALSIDAANIDADVIDIAADAVTTANVMDVSADALTTGGILNLVSDSSDTSARSLVTIKNDNTAATATTLLHLINDSTSASADVLIESTDAGAAAAPKMHFLRNSASPATDDVLGKVLFSGKDDGGNTTLYASIRAEINDETDSGGQEDGVIIFDIIKNASQKSALELKNNEAVFNNNGQDIDFRIESDDETHMLFIEGSTNRMSIGDSTDGPAATLEVTNHASAGATGAPLVQLNNNDVDQIALDINAANTTENTIHVVADALTTGRIALLESNSSDNSSRSLLKIHNNHSSATGTQPLTVQQDAIQGCAFFNNDNAETDFGTIVQLTRLSTTVADDMGCGIINFVGLTDAGTSTGFARISSEASDVSDATPRGKLILRAQLNIDGSEPNAVEELMSLGGGTGSNAPEVVINDLSYDVDFRVESNGETHMLFVDGGNNRVSIGDSTDTPAATLEISNASNGGVPLVLLDSNDTDKICLDIDAANIDADVIDIAADAVTTAFVMDVTADGLTTGGILNLVSDSSDTSDRTLVKVTNDNTGATGTTIMHLKSDAVTDDNPILLIESTAADTGPVLELRNTNAGVNREAILKFTRSDTSAEADDMDLGRLQFQGADSGNNDTIYVAILAEASDVTSGDEGGLLKFRLFSGGTGGTASSNTLFSIGGEDVAAGVIPAVVANEDGINCDFRVESEGEDEAIFLDASANALHINKGETAFETHIYSTNDVAMSVTSAGVVFNEDGHATNDFRVESDNITIAFGVNAGDDTIMAGGFDSSNHKDGFAVFNDFNATTFENKLTDGQFGSAEILRYSPGSSSSLVAGQLYFLNTTGAWATTRSDQGASGGESQMLGIGLGGNPQTVGCLIRGFIRIPSTEILNVPGSGAVDGLPVYVGGTAGHLDFNAPSSSGHFVRIVGYAIDDDGGDVLIYFNPDSTFVEIA